jgi:hypothetical protein
MICNPQTKRAGRVSKHSSSWLLGVLLGGLLGSSSFALTVPVAESAYASRSGTAYVIYASDTSPASLPVNGEHTALIQFDLEDSNVVPLAFIGTNISSAILELYVVSAASPGEVTIHGVNTAWSGHFAGKRAPAPTIDPAVLATIPAADVGKRSSLPLMLPPR